MYFEVDENVVLEYATAIPMTTKKRSTFGQRARLAAACVAVGLLLGAHCSNAYADAVDDVLLLKAKSQSRLKRFAADFVVDTTQPSTMPNPKTMRMRYRMVREKLPQSERTHGGSPWRLEMESFEPDRGKIRVEEGHVWTQEVGGPWIEVGGGTVNPESLSSNGVQSPTGVPSEQHKHFAIRVVGKNRNWLGRGTTTIEFAPKSKGALFHRMQEDVDDSGLPVGTRLYDAAGAVVTEIKVKKSRRIKGIPVIEEMETVAHTVAGDVVSRTTCNAIEVETEP